MTTPGAFESSEAAERLDERAQLLRYIADTLDLPVSLFRRRTAQGDDGPTAAECDAILATFLRIRDPEARRHCLALVSRCADAQE